MRALTSEQRRRAFGTESEQTAAEALHHERAALVDAPPSRNVLETDDDEARVTLGRSLRLAGRASDLYGKLLGAAMLLMLGLLFTIPIVHTLPLSALGVRVDPSAVSEAVLPWFMTLLVLFPSCSRSDTSSTWPPSAKTVGSW